MSRSVLPFILEGASAKADLDPEHLDSTGATTAARFWAGKYEGSNAKAACVERIAAVWRDRKRVEHILATLPAEQQLVLGVVKRYGGSISGTLLQRELWARGILRPEDPDAPVRFRRHQLSADPVLALCERLVLIREPGYYSYWSYGPLRDYPNVTLASQLAWAVTPAAPLAWKASKPSEQAPETSTSRAPAQMMMDLAQTARALEGQGTWKTNQGGSLPAAMRNRLTKLRPTGATDPLEPTDRIALDYAILDALGAIEHADGEAWLDRERTDRLLRQPLEVQASVWVQAWLSLRLWQDGIGSVPERDSDANPTRIDPRRLKQGRELLVWALARIAHNENDDWFDLETFVLDLYAQAGERGLDFYWHGFAWQPHFATAVGKDDIPAGPKRTRAFWMAQEGVWAANALFSTLVHLGVVERAGRAGQRATRWHFRLTTVGKAVFGAPEVALKSATGAEKCLTVQPNHDVLLYLDAVDGEAITILSRIASQESAAGLVQTFKLTRESVYGALQAGLSTAEIESFLSSRSRSGLPANVSQSIAEWSRKRDALVVRSDVALVSLPGGEAVDGRTLGAHLFLCSPRAASKAAKKLGAVTEARNPRRDWIVDEHGIVSPNDPVSMVGRARLRRVAEFEDGRWRITARSVRAARELGISTDRILDWLTAHASEGVPPILAMAIRNWASGREKVFLGRVELLQVKDLKAFEALNKSERFRPHIKGVLAPGIFVVTEEGRNEAAKLLREIGFSLDGECRFGSPEDTGTVRPELASTDHLLKLILGRPHRRKPRS